MSRLRSHYDLPAHRRDPTADAALRRVARHERRHPAPPAALTAIAHAFWLALSRPARHCDTALVIRAIQRFDAHA